MPDQDNNEVVLGTNGQAAHEAALAKAVEVVEEVLEEIGDEASKVIHAVEDALGFAPEPETASEPAVTTESPVAESPVAESPAVTETPAAQ